jgi:hypothetical protein
MIWVVAVDLYDSIMMLAAEKAGDVLGHGGNAAGAGFIGAPSHMRG